MTASRKFWIRAALSVAAVAAVAAVTAVMLAQSGWLRERIRARIVREVERATGGRVEIGAFDFNWRVLRAELRSFVLHGTEEAGEPPLFAAGTVEVGLRIVSVFRREVDIGLLRLDRPRVRIVVYPDGRTNLPQPEISRRSAKVMVEELLALAIRTFSIEDGLLEVNSEKIPLSLRGEGFKARMFYDRRGRGYTGRFDVDNVRLLAPAETPVAFRLSSSLAIRDNEVELRETRVTAGKSDLRVDGTIRDLASPKAGFTFSADLALDELAKPLRLPVIEGGNLKLAGEASIDGADDYRIDARLSGNALALRYQAAQAARGSRRPGVRLANLSAEARVRISPGAIDIDAADLAGLGGRFAGSASLSGRGRFRVAGEVKDVSVEQLGRLAQSELPGWSGRVSGPVAVTGVLMSSRLRDVKANARLTLGAEAGGLPVQGSVGLNYDQAAGLLELGHSYLATPASRLDFDGALGRSLRIVVQSQNVTELMPLVAALRKDSPGNLPFTLDGGVARFEGLVTGPLDQPRISGRVSLKEFLYGHHRFDKLDADVSISAEAAGARNLTLTASGMNVAGEARIGLRNWGTAEDSALAGSFSARNVPAGKLLAEFRSDFRAGGTLSGAAIVRGTLGAPEIAGKFQLSEPVLYGERFDSARADVRYAAGTLEVLNARIESGGSRLLGEGAFTPLERDWRKGALRFKVSGTRLALSRVPGTVIPPGIEGRIDLDASGEGAIESSNARLLSLQGSLRLREIQVRGKPAGELDWTAETKDGSLVLTVVGTISGAAVSGRSAWRLGGNYPVRGELRFTRLAVSSLRSWWMPGADPSGFPVEGFLDGHATFSGEGVDASRWSGRVEIPVFEMTPQPAVAERGAFRLVNKGPIVLQVDRGGLQIERALIAGKETDVEISGNVAFRAGNPLQLRVRGTVNLAALHNLDPDLTASGTSTVDASIRGRFSQPEIFGRLEFQNGSFYLTDIPNGIERASGTILFTRDRATIENVTAETGGGKLSFAGFAGFGGEQVVYRLQAEARQVRIRYPEGVSTTLNASLSLTGTATNSTVSGDVTVLRSGISPRVDLAGMLAQSSRPLVTPGVQNKLLRGMLFDVRIRTSPNARLETALTQDIQAEADLRLRGTPYKPVLLGRISATQGDVNFLGTRYNINRGDITFLNPVKLEPVVSLDLETRVTGTAVGITFTGPLDRLNVAYRSDPPLQPSEIIALLAVGRTPAADPAVTVRQTELDQASLGQLGATTLIGEALASPVTGRLQRFFGVSRIRIDPRLTGVENNPQTQVTLEQQVSRDVTFTYITNLSRSQEQVVRVEWNINRRWSILAVRDENGLFGIDVLFRKQFR